MRDQIKQLAQENNLKVTDLIALSPANDPFYVGSPAQTRAANWFSGLWQQFGYGDGVHLRRVHYQAQAQDPPVDLPLTLSWTVKDGPNKGQKQETDTYINNDTCWRYLCSAAKFARYLGIVDAGSFVDRRNPEAIINARYLKPDDWEYRNPTPRAEIEGGWAEKQNEWESDDADRYALPDLPELADLPNDLPGTPYLDAQGYVGAPQGYLVEIWTEKSTMDDVLNPLCEQYSVNYIRGLGEMSISSVIDFLNRVRDASHSARILYVSDHDPAGYQMPVSVARKIEFYLSALREEGHDIALQPIVLSQEQIDQYQLPPAPVKDNDKRKAGWDETHGEQSVVELDALEALHPGALAQIVEAEILNYYDPDHPQKLRNARYELQSLLDTETEEVIAKYQDKIEALESEYVALVDDWEETQDRFSYLVADFQPDIETHRSALDDITARTQELHQEIRDQLETIDVEAPEIPSPDLPEESDTLLYASDRSYLDQLSAYKHHRNGGTE